jgi:hypothetical protein
MTIDATRIDSGGEWQEVLVVAFAIGHEGGHKGQYISNKGKAENRA